MNVFRALPIEQRAGAFHGRVTLRLAQGRLRQREILGKGFPSPRDSP
jgi:hypothetical protein